MSKQNPAVIQFLGYRVTDISYQCNPSFEFPPDGVSYQFNFSKTNVLLSSTEIQENLKVNVFYSEDGTMDNAAYQLSIEMAGRFKCPSGWQERWEANAIAIMFPYLRSLVSMITSNSGRPPIILPTMNIASLFEKEPNAE